MKIKLAIALPLVFIGVSGIALAGMEIVCLDVGQAECTLMISPTGKTLLLDGGYTSDGTGTIVPYLRARGINTLDYMVTTHYHIDHIGGSDEIVNLLGISSIGAVLDRGWSYTTQAYTQYANAVSSKRATITDGQVLDLGGGMTVTCLGLNGNGQLSAPFTDEENDYCVALLVEYCDFDLFIAGDLSGVNSSSYSDIETSIAPEAGDVDIYRVDHHGSASNSNVALVSTLAPEVSVISVGDNSYGHPTQTVINRLVSYDSYIYQTEVGSGGTIPSGCGEVVGGNVVILADCTQYTVDGDVYSLAGSGVEVVQTPAALTVYPNPFSGEATARFALGGPGEVAVKIFDVEGRLVNAYGGVGGGGGNGAGTFTWNGTGLDRQTAAPGVYFIRVSNPSQSITQKVVKR